MHDQLRLGDDVGLAFYIFSSFSIEIIFVSIVQHQIELSCMFKKKKQQIEQLDGHYTMK